MPLCLERELALFTADGQAEEEDESTVLTLRPSHRRDSQGGQAVTPRRDWVEMKLFLKNKNDVRDDDNITIIMLLLLSSLM